MTFAPCRWPGCTEGGHGSRRLCREHERADARREQNGGRAGRRPKMTDDQRAEIRRRSRQFESNAAIARAMGLHLSSVRRVLRRA